MHLAGQPDAAHLRDLARMAGGEIVDGANRRIDQASGSCSDQSGLGREMASGASCFGQHGLRAVDEHDLHG